MSIDTRPSSTAARTAVIIGCGIAGPVLAQFMQRAGMTPVIYESQTAPRDDAGAFLNLAPDGLDVLNTLGIQEEILAAGFSCTGISFQNHRGKILGQYAAPSLLIRRGSLNRGLREAAIRRGVAIEYGERLRAVDITAGRTVIARFEDGTETRGDFLVGCDGIHSQTRQAIMPNAPRPVYTGVIDNGAIIHNPTIPPTDGAMRMTFGMEGFFGYLANQAGEVFWFENFARPVEPNRAELQAVSNTEWRQKLLTQHRRDHDPIAEIIGSTEEEIGRWPISEMPPLPTWHKGPVCLIGDAAHAASPHVGQGASMAMEDAIELAKCLRDVPDAEQAFVTYEALRKERVEQVVQAARRTGNKKLPTNAVTRRIRDAVLPLFLKMGAKSTAQVSSYRVDWDRQIA